MAKSYKRSEPAPRISENIPLVCHPKVREDWIEQNRIRLNPSRTHRKTFTGGRPQSLKPDAALLDACADPCSPFHTLACEVRDAWQFPCDETPIVLVPKGSPLLEGAPWTVSITSELTELEQPMERGVLATKRSLSRVLASLRQELKKGICPNQKFWLECCERLQGIAEELAARFALEDIPTLPDLLDALRAGSEVGAVGALWACSFDEAELAIERQKTEPVNYRNYIQRFIRSLQDEREKLTDDGTRDPELLGAEMLELAYSLASKKSISDDKVVSDFLFEILELRAAGEIKGSLEGFMKNHFDAFFVRSYWREQSKTRERIRSFTAPETEDGDMDAQADADDLLAARLLSVEEDARLQAGHAAAAALELLSPRLQMMVKMRAEADYAEMAQVLGGTPEGLRKEMKRGIAEAVPYPLKASVLRFRERTHRPLYRRTISFEEMATMLRKRLGPSKVEVSSPC